MVDRKDPIQCKIIRCNTKISCFYLALLNKHMKLCNTTTLQQAYQSLIANYADHFEYAVTLTLKQSIRFTPENQCYPIVQTLNDETLNSTIRYFSANLTRLLYGNQAKHKNKQHFAKPLIVVAVEGLNSYKLEHLHIGLGNVPEAKKANINLIVRDAWEQCDFANKQIKVEPIYNAQGWSAYITKEIGWQNDDALNIVASTIPQFIQSASAT